ncbi:MAG: hypothetical protein M3R13_05960 [Armatimonadota bacterium]|nr:hypothetical protein [Armatimonadota bacterium]
MLRAYIGREWDRIEGSPGSARRELDDYLDATKRTPSTSPSERAEPARAKAAPKRGTEVEEAYRVLKLEPNATLADLKRSFKTLSERSLPANFPEGSEEQKKAQAIHERVQRAYDLILPILDPRLRRFRSLWLE